MGGVGIDVGEGEREEEEEGKGEGVGEGEEEEKERRGEGKRKEGRSAPRLIRVPKEPVPNSHYLYLKMQEIDAVVRYLFLFFV